MEKRETYVALYCTDPVRVQTDFHSFHVDEEAANRAIDEADARLLADFGSRVTWRMEVRNARGVRDLVTALDARQAAVTLSAMLGLEVESIKVIPQ